MKSNKQKLRKEIEIENLLNKKLLLEKEIVVLEIKVNSLKRQRNEIFDEILADVKKYFYQDNSAMYG